MQTTLNMCVWCLHTYRLVSDKTVIINVLTTEQLKLHYKPNFIKTWEKLKIVCKNNWLHFQQQVKSNNKHVNGEKTRITTSRLRSGPVKLKDCGLRHSSGKPAFTSIPHNWFYTSTQC